MSDIPPKQSIPVGASGSSNPSLSVELERDAYREKVEHFKILIRKLQEENQTYKLRKESTETVSRLLQESKQEVVALQNKLGVADSVIRVLQSRLQANGLSPDVFPQEGEPYYPGQSKNLLDNLTRENKRLRSLIRSRSGDPEEFAKIQQRNEELERECSELRICSSNWQTRIAELELVLRSSDNEKDRAINALNEQLGQVTRELNARDNQCTTLAEETRMLQTQLEDVARQCQELAKRLQEQGHNNDKIVEKALKTSATEVTESAKSVADENKHLKQKVKEITEMNKRWQDYNNQREAYVKALTAEIATLKKRLEDAQPNTVPHETQVEMNKILDESRRLVRELDNEKAMRSNATKELSRVNNTLITVNGQLTELRNENQQLRRHLEAVTDQDSAGTINALKAQIRICTEDFESERADRQKAHEKLNKQKQETERLRKEVESLRREMARQQASPRVQTSQAQPQFNDPFYHYQMAGPGGNLSSEGLAARGSSPQLRVSSGQRTIDKYNVIDRNNVVDCADTHVDGNAYNDEINISKSDDSKPFVSLNTSSISSKDNKSVSSRNSARHSDSDSLDDEVLISRSPSARTDDVKYHVTAKADDILRCPNCNKSFTSQEHPELLEHMESCVD